MMADRGAMSILPSAIAGLKVKYNRILAAIAIIMLLVMAIASLKVRSKIFNFGEQRIYGKSVRTITK
jgi:hypothetical protein